LTFEIAEARAKESIENGQLTTDNGTMVSGLDLIGFQLSV